LKKRWRFKFDQARQKFLLTLAEKRVVIFVLGAFMLGLGTKCYRDAHLPPPALPPSKKAYRASASGPSLRPASTASISDSPVLPSTPARKRTQKATPP